MDGHRKQATEKPPTKTSKGIGDVCNIQNVQEFRQLMKCKKR